MQEKRVIKAITVSSPSEDSSGDCLYALCNDGTTWSLYLGPREGEARWFRLPDIPQNKGTS